MSEERPSKVRKSRRTDTINKPDTVVEMAEPLPEPTKEEEGKGRNRQLTTDNVPFEFLPPAEREEILQAKIRRDMAEEVKREQDELNGAKAKAILGIFIGAGIGMWAAYLLKDKLFPPAVAAAIEAASDIVERSTD